MMNRERYFAYRAKLNFDFQYRWFLSHCAQDALLWGLVYFLMQQELTFAWLSAFPIAALLFRNFSFMHEAVHNTAHSNAKVNYALGLFSGAVCFLPYQLWKTIHVEHHNWAGNYQQDSALELVKRYPSHSPLTKSIFELMWKTRFPWMALFQYVVFWAHSTLRLFKASRDLKFWASYLAPCLFWGGVIWLLNPTQLIALAGGIFVYSMLFDYVNLAHHAGVNIKESYDRKPTWDQLDIARTGRYSRQLERLILNFNFHSEHHMFPDLPCSELLKAHELLKEGGDTRYYEIVGPGWLRSQRKKTFASFIRPDLYGQQSEKIDSAA